MLKDRFLNTAPRYLVVGICNTLIGLAIILTARLFMSEWQANTLGYLLSIPIGFITHRNISFRHQGNLTSTFWKYIFACVFSLLMNYLVLHNALAMGLPGAFAQVCAVAAYVVSNWILCACVVFGRDEKAWLEFETHTENVSQQVEHSPQGHLPHQASFKWVRPHLSFKLTGVTLSLPFFVFALIFFYCAASPRITGVSDPDFFWHIEYGKWILEHMSLPTVDMWSWTMLGEPYQLTQWLGEAIMGGVYLITGNALGNGILCALLLTLTLAASYSAARIYMDNRIAALMLCLFFNLILFSLVARPQNFTHLCLALLSWILASYDNGNKRALWYLPPLFLLWTNLHGAFSFGFLVCVLYYGSLISSAVVTRQNVKLKETLRTFTPFLLLAFLATLINPYGFGVWEIFYKFTQMQAVTSNLVSEWLPTNIKNDIGLQYFSVTAVLFAAIATTRVRMRLHDLFYSLALMAVGWFSVRTSLMSSLMLVPVAAAVIRHTAFYDLAFDGKNTKYDRPLPFVPSILVLCAFAFISWEVQGGDDRADALRASVPVEQTHDLPSRKEIPPQPALDTSHGLQQLGTFGLKTIPFVEVQHLKTHNIPANRVLNNWEIGGYLISQGIPVILDSRLELYGDEAMLALEKAVAGRHGWDDYIRKMNPDVVIIHRRTPLVSLLLKHNLFKPVISSDHFILMVKSDGA